MDSHIPPYLAAGIRLSSWDNSDVKPQETVRPLEKRQDKPNS